MRYCSSSVMNEISSAVHQLEELIPDRQIIGLNNKHNSIEMFFFNFLIP